METAVASALTKLLEQGPLGIALAIMVWLYLREKDVVKEERARVAALADKLYELGVAMVRASTETKGTLEQVSKEVDRLHDDRGSK